MCSTYDDDPRSQVVQIVQAGLGHSVDDQVIDQLVKMRAELQSRQGEIAHLLVTEKISRVTYIEQLDAILQEAAVAGRLALGSDDFQKIFGEFRVHNLVDVSMFLTAVD
jgi:hypothetical protein